MSDYDRYAMWMAYFTEREPMKHAEYREQVIQKQIDLMHERGIWVKPER